MPFVPLHPKAEAIYNELRQANARRRHKDRVEGAWMKLMPDYHDEEYCYDDDCELCPDDDWDGEYYTDPDNAGVPALLRRIATLERQLAQYQDQAFVEACGPPAAFCAPLEPHYDPLDVAWTPTTMENVTAMGFWDDTEEPTDAGPPNIGTPICAVCGLVHDPLSDHLVSPPGASLPVTRQELIDRVLSGLDAHPKVFGPWSDDLNQAPPPGQSGWTVDLAGPATVTDWPDASLKAADPANDRLVYLETIVETIAAINKPDYMGRCYFCDEIMTWEAGGGLRDVTRHAPPCPWQLARQYIADQRA